MGAMGSPQYNDHLLQRHFLGAGAGADPLIREASLVGQANGNPQLAAAAADLAEAEAELVRLRSLRALRAGGALPPQHQHHSSMPSLPPGAGASTGTGTTPPSAAGASTGMPPPPPAVDASAAALSSEAAAAIAAATATASPSTNAPAAAPGAGSVEKKQEAEAVQAALPQQEATVPTQESQVLLNQQAAMATNPGNPNPSTEGSGSV